MLFVVGFNLAIAKEGVRYYSMRRKGTADLQARQIDGNSLNYLIVEPDGYDETLEYPTIVLLHGFGASMSDLVGLAPAIDRTGYVYLFPNAPIPMQIGMGMTGYAWTPPGGDGNGHAAQRAEDLLAAFFDEVCERHALTHGEIVMGGFSQGGMMTYRFGLPRPEMFAGLAILSGHVPSPDALSERLPEHRGQPIFVAHGTHDNLIDVSEARRSRRFLESSGYAPQYHEYEMGHEINQDVLSTLNTWLRDLMPPLRMI